MSGLWLAQKPPNKAVTRLSWPDYHSLFSIFHLAPCYCRTSVYKGLMIFTVRWSFDPGALDSLYYSQGELTLQETQTCRPGKVPCVSGQHVPEIKAAHGHGYDARLMLPQHLSSWERRIKLVLSCPISCFSRSWLVPEVCKVYGGLGQDICWPKELLSLDCLSTDHPFNMRAAVEISWLP